MFTCFLFIFCLFCLFFNSRLLGFNIIDDLLFDFISEFRRVKISLCSALLDEKDDLEYAICFCTVPIILFKA